MACLAVIVIWLRIRYRVQKVRHLVNKLTPDNHHSFYVVWFHHLTILLLPREEDNSNIANVLIVDFFQCDYVCNKDTKWHESCAFFNPWEVAGLPLD